ncbi:MAG: hypothetical protein SP1CHLAM54_11010 [Chlamydiia bacterium]|nr:hypothetical protein [Chlamydiia bacterium]MCH9616006.1 hypothetical protein [Chlamydiia bacterium]MCH9629029.1 hypothetical protein [Chlamydiia bacterium]
MTFNLLPSGVVHELVTYLPFDDIVRIRPTERRINQIAKAVLQMQLVALGLLPTGLSPTLYDKMVPGTLRKAYSAARSCLVLYSKELLGGVEGIPKPLSGFRRFMVTLHLVKGPPLNMHQLLKRVDTLTFIFMLYSNAEFYKTKGISALHEVILLKLPEVSEPLEGEERLQSKMNACLRAATLAGDVDALRVLIRAGGTVSHTEVELAAWEGKKHLVQFLLREISPDDPPETSARSYQDVMDRVSLARMEFVLTNMGW